MSSFDLNSIKRQSKPVLKPDHPEAIFKTIAGRVGFLRAPQADAIRAWYLQRDEPDILLNLSTGAGKTLVALLAAQSILNSRLGKVLYVCATKQLVEQTAEQAGRYGLPITTYLDVEFSNDAFAKNTASCVTTYHAAFHKFSKFQQHDIGLLILDDAHTAQSVFRSMYSIILSRNDFQNALAEIGSIVEPYYASIDQRVSFVELTQGIGADTKLIPPHIIKRHLTSIQAVLLSLRLHERRYLKYPWAFLQDKLNRCAFLWSRDGLTITPPVVPVERNPVFSSATRRLYLSATLAGEDTFLRTFGKVPADNVHRDAAPRLDVDGRNYQILW